MRPLTNLQRQALLWAARGKTYQDIAQIMYVSLGSVKGSLDAGKLKLQANNLPHAVALAYETRIFHLGDLEHGSDAIDAFRERGRHGI